MDRLLVLARHGQSEWNLKNLFTGWRNPDLTERGVDEAHKAGRWLKSEGYGFDVAFTSNLGRAQRTCKLMLGGNGPLRHRDDPLGGPERARLRRPVRPQQGGRQGALGRRAGAPVAPLLRRAAARRREPEGHRGPRAALLHRDDPAPGDERRPGARRRPRQLAARPGDGARPPEHPTIAGLEIATGVPLVYRLKADTTVASKTVLERDIDDA